MNELTKLQKARAMQCFGELAEEVELALNPEQALDITKKQFNCVDCDAHKYCKKLAIAITQQLPEPGGIIKLKKGGDKVKIISKEIEKATDCPNYAERGSYCLLTKGNNRGHKTCRDYPFPKWCPLPDKK